MRVFIDTEFNGFGGELISIALVAEDGSQYYELVKYPAPHLTHPWVKRNVLPHIEDAMEPVGKLTVMGSLSKWLKSLGEDVEVVANWPEDLKHFWDCLTHDGTLYGLPTNLKTTLDRSYSTSDSLTPHNALEDAWAMLRQYEKRSL